MIENSLETKLLKKAEQAKEEKDYSTVVETYEKLLEIQKKAGFFNQLAIAHYHLEQFEKASEYVEDALSMDNDFYHAWITKGNIHAQKKNFNKAIHAYQRALQLKPLEALPAYCLGVVYQELQEYEKAEESLQRALDFEKRDYLIWLELARVHFRQSHYGRAIRYAKRTLRLKELSECYVILAVSHYKKNDIKRALKYQKKVVSLLPNNKDAYKFLAKIYHEIGKNEKAREVLTKLKDLEKK